MRTSLNSFVALIKRFFRSSTTVVEWLVVSLEIFPLSFLELLRSWRSTTAEFRAVISCFITAVSSWISMVGSSKTEVLLATVNQGNSNCQYMYLHIIDVDQNSYFFMHADYRLSHSPFFSRHDNVIDICGTILCLYFTNTKFRYYCLILLQSLDMESK